MSRPLEAAITIRYVMRMLTNEAMTPDARGNDPDPRNAHSRQVRRWREADPAVKAAFIAGFIGLLGTVLTLYVQHTSTSSGPATSEPTEASAEPLTVSQHHIADLTAATGAEWRHYAPTLGGKTVPHSLGWMDPCHTPDRQQAEYDLRGSYRHLTAVVGVDDNGSYPRGYVTFKVYADRNGNGIGEPEELAGTGEALRRQPAQIDADIHGARRIILYIEPPTGCFTGAAIWGNPRFF